MTEKEKFEACTLPVKHLGLHAAYRHGEATTTWSNISADRP